MFHPYTPAWQEIDSVNWIRTQETYVLLGRRHDNRHLVLVNNDESNSRNNLQNLLQIQKIVDEEALKVTGYRTNSYRITSSDKADKIMRYIKEPNSNS